MINCKNFRENICAYIDNELNIKERLSFDEHVNNCSDCKRELDEMIRIVALCTELPQQELPVDFKAGLHEKLTAVAGRQENKVISIKKPRGFLFLKTFASVAAALLLVLLAGGVYKFGWFSPEKMHDFANTTALSMKKPEAPMDAAVAATYGSDSNVEIAGGTVTQSKEFSAPAIVQSPAKAAATDETPEVNRSAAVQNRIAAASEKTAGIESVNSRISTITVSADDPDKLVEKIKTLAIANNAEIVDNTKKVLTFSQNTTAEKQNINDHGIMADAAADNAGKAGNATGNTTGNATGSTTGNVTGNATSNATGNATGNATSNSAGNAGSPLQKQLVFNISGIQYEQFVSALNKEFGVANVQTGAFVTEDMTISLNSAIADSNEADNRIQELQKEDGTKNASEIEKLKARKEAADKRIDELRLGNDFVYVTVLINGK